MDKIKSIYHKYPNITILIISIILGFLSALFINQISSFIYTLSSGQDFSLDASSFLYGGKLLLLGYKPYFDMYETKGIYIFYYSALGNLLGGRIGMIFIQTITLSITYYFFFKTLLVYEIRFIASLLGLMTFASIYNLIGQSPSVTEIVLPMTSIALYFYINAVKEDNDRYYLYGNIANGVAVGLAINSRPTDAIIAFSLVIYFAVIEVIHKKYLNILTNAGVCILAIVLTSLPAFIHGLAGGFLYEMYDAAIFSNFSYVSGTHSGASTFKLSARIIITFILLVMLTLIFIAYRKKKFNLEETLFYTISISISLIIQFVIAFYLHYLLIEIPLLVLLVTRFITSFNLSKRTSIIFASIVGVLTLASYITHPIIYYTNEYQRDIEINEYVKSVIDEEDRNKNVMGYNISCSIYLNNDITVGYGNYTFQSNHISTSKVFTLDALIEYSKSIKYIIIDNRIAESDKGDPYLEWLYNESGYIRDISTLKGAEHISIYINE